MATEKILNTRVQLKYDSYENWIATANQFKLRPGEVAVVNINGANGANLNNGTENTVVQPTILFKVGIGNPADDTTWKTFNQLPWASALAADVHAWAKQANVTVSGNGNAITAAEVVGDKLTFTKGTTFATKAELDAAIEAFGGDLSAITDNDHVYTFAVPADGDDAGKLVITETNYINGEAGETATYKFDFVTPDELTKILEDYYTAEEIDALVTGKLHTEEEIKAMAIAHADAAGKVDNALTIKVGGTDVVFDGSAAQTANVDTAIAAAIAEEGHPEYAIEKDANAGEYAAVYHLTKDGERITGSTINIPKDMVVESGAVVTNPDGQPAGTYIKLVLQNVTDPLYINVGDLIEYVTSGSKKDDMVVIHVNNDHKVTATITEKSITDDKLAETYTKKSEFNELFRKGADLMVNMADYANVACQAHYDNENRKIVDTYKVKQTVLADKGLTGANVLASLSQNANGEIAYETRALIPADIGAQPAGNYKITQDEKNYTGSTVKTVTEVKQDINGVITEVKFEDIAFPAPPKGTGEVAIATIENDIVTLNGGVKLNDHTLEDDTAKADITLAKIAKTGSIYDVKEGFVEGTSEADKAIGLKYLVFNCGTASTVI